MLLWIVIRPSSGRRSIRLLEEILVALEAEVLERLDGQDPVDGLVELLPSAQQYPPGFGRSRLTEQLRAEAGVLISAQRQADDVDIVPLDRAA